MVLPSDDEPWGVVINEAVAAGLAVVATDVVGAAAELVRDRVNGRIVAPNDPAPLAAALLDVTSPESLMAYRAACPSVLARWRHNADPVAGLLRALSHANVIPLT
jgi:glycosyltransferase involved in cell wall biosynthesis